MVNQPLDILAINETRLGRSIMDSDVSLNGYDLIRNDRNRNGGGVCIYIRNTIQYKIRDDISLNSIEAICLDICKPNSK